MLPTLSERTAPSDGAWGCPACSLSVEADRCCSLRTRALSRLSQMVKCWDLETNKVIRQYHGHLSGVYALECVAPRARPLPARARDIG